MLKLSRINVREYLAKHHLIAPDEQVVTRTRVSNAQAIVISIYRNGTRWELPIFTIKQVRPLTRRGVQCRETLNRIWNEIAFLEFAQSLCAEYRWIRPPRIHFKDRNNFLYGTREWPWWSGSWSTWTASVLKGETDDRLAAECGSFLARVHGTSWDAGRSVVDLSDRRSFQFQFLEPCVEHFADQSFALNAVEDSLDAMWGTRRCIVHGRFTLDVPGKYSPTLSHCDLAHYGDPAFDIGSFLASLMLGMLAVAPDRRGGVLHMIHEFCTSYRGLMLPIVGAREFESIWNRAVRLTGTCLLFRAAAERNLDSKQVAQLRAVVWQLWSKRPSDAAALVFELSRLLPLDVSIPRPWFYENRLNLS